MDKAKVIHNLYVMSVLHNDLTLAIETALENSGFDPKEAERLAQNITDDGIHAVIKPYLHKAIDGRAELERLYKESQRESQEDESRKASAFDELGHDMYIIGYAMVGRD